VVECHTNLITKVGIAGRSGQE